MSAANVSMGRLPYISNLAEGRPLGGAGETRRSFFHGRYADTLVRLNERQLFGIAQPEAASPLATISTGKAALDAWLLQLASS